MRRIIQQRDPIIAGRQGEEFARIWMSDAEWEWHRVDQSRYNKSELLKKYNAKRPDFFVIRGDTCIFVDAKYHSTFDRRTFWLSAEEMGKYLNLLDCMEKEFNGETFDLLFMLFPKESYGGEVTFVGPGRFLRERPLGRLRRGTRFRIEHRGSPQRHYVDVQHSNKASRCLLTLQGKYA
jgi:hypothetical protein